MDLVITHATNTDFPADVTTTKVTEYFKVHERTLASHFPPGTGLPDMHCDFGINYENGIAKVVCSLYNDLSIGRSWDDGRDNHSSSEESSSSRDSDDIIKMSDIEDEVDGAVEKI